MTIERRFVIAPALARLVRKERGVSGRTVEGYFSAQNDRTHYVSIEAGHCFLVLSGAGGETEERTEVPRPHAEALLDVCAGKVAFDRTAIAIGGGREAFLDRYMTPGPLDLLTVVFEQTRDSEGFYPPAWFGQEVTGDAAYGKSAIALSGPPQVGEVPLSNAALNALLDTLEARFGFGRYGQTALRGGPEPRAEARAPSSETRVTDAFRRLASATQAQAPAPANAGEDEIFAGAESKPEAQAETARSDEAATPPAGGIEDSRIDDVISSLSQALENPGAQGFGGRAEPAPAPAPEPQRFSLRPRRT